MYRDGHRMRLTEAGDRVYRWATDTLSGTRELMRELDGLNDGGRGTVAVAASMSVGSYVLPPILAAFRNQRPRAVITLVVSDPEHAVQGVESGDCDLGVIVADASRERPSLIYEVIGREQIVLVAASDFSPATTALSLKSLSEMPLISSPRAHVRRELVDRQLASHGVFPQNVVMELGHPEAMKRATQSGLGVCLLFRSSVEQELSQGTLREIQIQDAELFVPLIIATRATKRLSTIQQQLVEAIRRHLSAREP
jgi:DNA-binding transcriptional LysR family regulator